MITLLLTAAVPHPGGDAVVVVSNAVPGETIGFLASLGGTSAGPCPPLLGGLCLDLGADTVLSGTAVADASGRATLEIPVPSSLPVGTTVTFQAAARRGAGGASSVKSNAVVRTVGDPAWFNGIHLNGALGDWSADELFPTTSGGNTLGGVTWDRDRLYVTFQHPDVATGGPEHWEVVTIGTGAGSASVPPLNTQQPGLPFAASLQLRRKADGSYDDLQQWDGARWVSTPNVLTTMPYAAAAELGDVVEIALPRSLLGTSRIQVALYEVYEGAGFESTYGGVPDTAFVDGYDPDVVEALTLDLSSPDPAGVQNP